MGLFLEIWGKITDFVSYNPIAFYRLSVLRFWDYPISLVKRKAVLPPSRTLEGRGLAPKDGYQNRMT